MDDPVTKALLDVLPASGVTVTHEPTPAGQHRLTAIDPDTKQTSIVTDPELYAAVYEVAQAMVGARPRVAGHSTQA